MNVSRAKSAKRKAQSAKRREQSARRPALCSLPSAPCGPPAPVAVLSWGQRINAYLELTKPRINTLILLVAVGGYWLGSAGSPDPWRLLITVIGIGLLGGGIFALNQYLERDLDALMRRTEMRPLPTQRLLPVQALWFGITLSVLAVLCLGVGANWLSGALALFTLGSYLFAYTPLKTRTPHCTLIGAIPGAMPPLLGWAAACGETPVEAWVLFSILFLWQFPHFHSIAWLYREDYARAGIRMLPVIETDGKLTGQQIIASSLTLLAVSLLPTFLGVAGTVYLGGALILGLAFVYMSVQTALVKSKGEARQLLLASVFYLPLIFGLMVFDSSGR